MTLDNGIGGTTVVTASPSSSAAAASPGSMKHSLRSAVVAQVDAAETALLVNEEEKLMATNDIVDDEEVTSEEEEPDNEATERAMLTVALVKSVVETRALNHPGAPAGTPSSPGAHAYGLRKRRRPSGQDLERLEHFQSTKDGGLARVAKAPDVSTAPTGSAALLQHPPQEPPKLKKSVDSRDMKPPARPPRPPNLVQSAASSVPNPLLNKMDSPATAPVSATVHLESLSSYLLPDQDPGRNAFPVAVASEAQVAGASAESADRRKVTINEPELSSRKRGFSVDLDFFELGEHTFSGPTDAGGRERTYSFECFAFGINADEPLPPLDQVNQSSLALDQHGRPRGDSIIFDPSSFQDGGIHEQTALEKHVSDAKAGSISKARVAAAVPGASIPSSFDSRSDSAPCALDREHTNLDNPVDDLVSRSGAATSAATEPAGTATLSLELLNKGGRIGIYLPEARRARIARFHAKRSRRIWRKRIKYDCRKKLADSRPRIKGRFVKRTDMDD